MFAGIGIGLLLMVLVVWIIAQGVLWAIFGTLRDLVWAKYIKRYGRFIDLLLTGVLGGAALSFVFGGVSLTSIGQSVIMTGIMLAWALFIVFPMFKWKTPV